MGAAAAGEGWKQSLVRAPEPACVLFSSKAVGRNEESSGSEKEASKLDSYCNCLYLFSRAPPTRAPDLGPLSGRLSLSSKLGVLYARR